MSARQRRMPGAAGLGALWLGLLTAPWVYVTLFGALFAFPWPLAAVMTPLLLGATLELGLEAFGRLRGFPWARRLGAAMSTGVVLASLWVLSDFTLLTQAERVGLFATVWLGSSLVWLVVSLPLGAVGPEALPALAPELTGATAGRVGNGPPPVRGAVRARPVPSDDTSEFHRRPALAGSDRMTRGDTGCVLAWGPVSGAATTPRKVSRRVPARPPRTGDRHGRSPRRPAPARTDGRRAW